MADYCFEQVKTDAASISASAKLLATTFGRYALFTPAYIRWQYAENPDGPIVGFNAFLNGELAAHYVAQPVTAYINGREVRGLLSLNTATAQAHRGQGLFPKLAQQTYALAKELGYEFIIGVANQNSVNGFVNKLGFQLVGQFSAMAGLGRAPLPKLEVEVSYMRKWNAETLQWRLSNPSNAYYIEQRGKQFQVFSKTNYPFIDAVLGAYTLTDASVIACTEKKPPVFKIWLGMDARTNFNKSAFLNIPTKLRPAPLHLIYKGLSENCTSKLSAASVVFQALDFDAY